MPALVVRSSGFGEAERTLLTETLLGSPLLARSPLAGGFAESRGWAIVFTDAGRAGVEARYPGLERFFAEAIDGPDWRRLRPLVARLGGRRPPNAFYLNLLVLGSGRGVDRHTDGTLRSHSGDADALPRLVSVLYLRMPRGAHGGRLRLFDEERLVAEHAPREGELLSFRGDLAHEVDPFQLGPAPPGAPAVDEPGASRTVDVDPPHAAPVPLAPEPPHAASEPLRVSLVLEQYHLRPEPLAQLPELKVQSKARFDAYLSEWERTRSRR